MKIKDMPKLHIFCYNAMVSNSLPANDENFAKVGDEQVPRELEALAYYAEQDFGRLDEETVGHMGGDADGGRWAPPFYNNATPENADWETPDMHGPAPGSALYVLEKLFY
jgi:hypothetical protein